MLKNEQTIANLSLEQKLNLIANVSSLGGVLVEGQQTPFLNEVDFSKSETWQDFPSFNNLCRSFNPELIREVSEVLITRYQKNGVNLITLPSAKVKVSPYSVGVSEDEYLSGELVGAVVRASKNCGVCTVASDPLLTEEDVKYSDITPDSIAIKDHFFAPLNKLKQVGVDAVITKEKQISKEYNEFNEQMIERIKEDGIAIIKDVSERANIEGHNIDVNTLYKGLSVSELKQLHETYLKFMEEFKAGEVALSEINSICEKGGALSSEMIDQAVDKILEFTEQCLNGKQNVSKAVDNEQLIYRAMAESTVLLKNDNVLPLSKRRKVAVIGSVFGFNGGEFVSAVQTLHKSHVLYAKGYGDANSINSEDIKKAVQIARSAEVVIVGLGYTSSEYDAFKNVKSTRLPAQQQALLLELAKHNVKTIAVLFGEREFDMSFDSLVSAVIMAPSDNYYGMNVLASIIHGKANPSGRLLNTAYTNTEQHFEKLFNYKNSKRNKVGPYYGYKHYDTAGLKEKYAFGFGLSYSAFKILSLKVSGQVITLKVKNVGKKVASQSVQIYVGKTNSVLVRPLKELKAIAKVCLKPKKTKTISFCIKDLDLGTHCASDGLTLIEAGEYKVYAGLSVNQIYEQVKINVNGTKLADAKFDRKPSSYFQNYGNILDGKYYLEQPYGKPIKTGKVKFVVALTFITSILLMLYGYLDYINFLPTINIAYFVAGPLTLTLFALIFLFKSLNKKRLKNNLGMSKKMKKEILENIDQSLISEEIPFEQLFEDEFATPVVNVENEKTEQAVIEKEEKHFEFDKSLTFNALADGFIELCKNEKLHVEFETMRSLFAGFASSRLIILDADDKNLLNSVIDLLGRYLGCKVVSESYDSISENGGDIIHCKSENHVNGITNIASSLMDKTIDETLMRIMCVRDVVASDVKHLLTHVFRYIDQLGRDSKLTVQTKDGELTVDMPNNVWFVLTLKDEEKLVDIPKYILDDSCHIEVKVRLEEEIIIEEKPKRKGRKSKTQETEEEKAVETIETIKTDNFVQVEQRAEEAAEVQTAEEQMAQECSNVEQSIEEIEQQENLEGEIEVLEQTETELENEIVIEEELVSAVGIQQFEMMVQNAEKNYQLDENMWKRLDRLEENVNKANSSYRISSKQWQKTEKYASVYLSAGGEMEETLDSVVANQIISGMSLSIIEGQNNTEEKFVSVVESIFGEGHAPRTIRKVKKSGAKI